MNLDHERETMPVISATVIQKARVVRRCETCRRIMPEGEPQVRCFGRACEHDTPYNVWLCLSCNDERRERATREVSHAVV